MEKSPKGVATDKGTFKESDIKFSLCMKD